MPVTWRVVLNRKLWDQEKYIARCKEYPESKYLPQSKGNAKMVKVPSKGDIVYFVLKGKIIMEGCLETDGFIRGDAHRNHSCNIGQIRPHTDNDEYAICKITRGIEDDFVAVAIPHTGQRTWQVYNP